MWLGLLGPLQVRHGEVTPQVAAAKQRVVLATLLTHANQVVSFDDLARMTWDGAPPRAARVTLRNYVLRLRQALGPQIGGRIITHDPGYLIEAGEDELDLLCFTGLCGSGGAAIRAGEWQEADSKLGRALRLWRGTPLADVPSEVLRDQEVPGLEQLRLQACEWQMEAGLHLGRHGQLLSGLRSMVTAHPLREHFCAQLMLALYRCGRQAEALAAYQEARRFLIAEVGVEPGPELQQLHQAILTADPRLTAVAPPASLAAADGIGDPGTGQDRAVPPGSQPEAGDRGRQPVVPRQLPSSARHFVGRAAELTALSALLEESTASPGTVVISAIGGSAGVGKTTLAVHWARQMSALFPDGQLYVNLRGYGPSLAPVAPAEAIRGFLTALHVPPEQVPIMPEAQSALFRSLLADRRMLIVLDNARDAAQIRPLLPGSPASMVVVTSRSQLAGLVATEGARLLTVGVLSDDDAMELLACRLGAQPIAAEPGAARSLIALCAGLPLALAIVAARGAASRPVRLAGLASELRTAPRPLDALDCDDPLASVRTVFSWSYELLGTAAARMFRLLVAHCGPDISPAAAASLAAVPPGEAAAILSELAAAHLLQECRPGRFACHDLLRAYAAERADSAGDGAGQAAARDRVLDHYLHTGVAAALLLYPARDPVILAPPRCGVTPERLATYAEALAWFQAEHDVLVAACAQAAADGYDVHAWQLPWTLLHYLDLTGRWQELAVLESGAIAAARRHGDRRGLAHAHCDLGRAYVRLGRPDKAGPQLRYALALREQLGEIAAQARIRLDLAQVATARGQDGEALVQARHALRLYRTAGFRPGQARALNNLGWYHGKLGDFQQALARCREALTINTELGNRPGEAASSDSVGFACLRLGRPAEALAHFRRAMGLFTELGDRYNLAVTLGHLGDGYEACGQHDRAGQERRAALAILDELHHPEARWLRAELGRLGPAPGARAGHGSARELAVRPAAGRGGLQQPAPATGGSGRGAARPARGVADLAAGAAYWLP